MSEFPFCTVCKAPVSLRAKFCAVCDAPAPPQKKSVPSGEIRSGEWVRFERPPAELKPLYDEVVKALLPDIRILGMVGEGGMALVFVGRDVTLKREVAVKLLSPTLADDEVARQRFTLEAESIAAVNHPNIVNVYRVGVLPGRNIPYFVMQFVDGPTLGLGALRGRSLTEARVRRLLTDVGQGLAAAHRRKIYHRDIKPGNIVLDGETGRAMVLDFGISAVYSSRRKVGSKLTDEGMYVGTPTYMAPEQGGGETVSGASDVYSLGILAFELLLGRPPFEGNPLTVMASHSNQVPPRVDSLRADVSDELSTLIGRCLAKHPEDRPSAEEIVHLLRPDLKQVVEWPPPGMARVRAAGARLVLSATATSVATAMFFGVLVIRGEELAILRGAGSEPSVWRSFALGASLAILFAFSTMFLLYCVFALQRWQWAVATGYPTWVVADVLCDAQRDTGSLINGTDEFALVPGEIRDKLLRLRRARLLLLVLASAVAMAGMLRWVTAWLLSGGSHAAQEVATFWALPIVIVFTLYFLAGGPEFRVRRAEHRKHVGVPGSADMPPVKSELVDMWLASAAKARKSFPTAKNKK